jgi:hypothetical protein
MSTQQLPQLSSPLTEMPSPLSNYVGAVERVVEQLATLPLEVVGPGVSMSSQQYQLLEDQAILSLWVKQQQVQQLQRLAAEILLSQLQLLSPKAEQVQHPQQELEQDKQEAQQAVWEIL